MNTPTPVEVECFGRDIFIMAHSKPIAKLFKHPDAPERAAEIVRAVNYHDRLVDMVQKLSDELGYSLSNSASVMGVKFNHTDNSLINTAQQLLTEIKESNGK